MKNTYRFFVAPELLTAEVVTLDDTELVHQLVRVLRLTPGAQIMLLDGLGNQYTLELTAVSRVCVVGHVLTTGPAPDPTYDLSLYVALIRPERFEWVLQKGTELGVRRFVPVSFSRCLANECADGRKTERWQRIIREAAEQAWRGRVPILSPALSFAAACAEAATAHFPLILWEGDAPPLRDRLRPPAPHASYAILSGPEGGITSEELALATQHAIMPASLGTHILRAETAPIMAAAALSYELGGEDHASHQSMRS
ncbi:RsmE family RNA methyltransferase [Candidatus Oscillochloris fontis]|uniref:RsmE family RNA methyltransferase n=1 Tax=Candidatus Oscillochloris fontis TaxID=2496868 RepID=UPI00101DAE95|nr:RsmE family RNA methyltransferase [Candidatus Oscillochloris fontis]